jgi:hypothetical protein
MEIIAYALFSGFCFLGYFLAHKRDDELITPQTISHRAFLGVLFICLAIMSLKLTYLEPTGTTLTVYSIQVNLDPDSNMWQAGLFLLYIFTGFLEIIYAILDAIDWRQEKRKREEEAI